ncbi:hypothetical protein CHGG_00987 [Chaetomium globosum CBS 148.51]|uniref:MICOS complex subunit n=1 Tax=Chaetomium globosum (strain ATCC 6205 / CBS 148.51 / DSM 1962 / NBRC 6347 / NRRL 1970) TaxID=306901 RepID=Q2HFL7_CHAGB|nr:uncharacterized protein CHGG_00987 [Chaetomium globosum CBS 148.51]EAQ92752.1 hypothetical protein CHGG_00987 [Chaetomium globosum CBS 148.51]
MASRVLLQRRVAPLTAAALVGTVAFYPRTAHAEAPSERQYSCVAEDAVNGAMARAFAAERSFTSTVASLAPPRESGERLMPGLIYVLVAGMAGSIVARNRNVLVRGAAPLALGLGAAWTVLPVTMGNVGALAWEYEKRVPAVADAHLRAREGVEKGVYMARVHAELAQRKVHEGA